MIQSFDASKALLEMFSFFVFRFLRVFFLCVGSCLQQRWIETTHVVFVGKHQKVRDNGGNSSLGCYIVRFFQTSCRWNSCVLVSEVDSSPSCFLQRMIPNSYCKSENLIKPSSKTLNKLNCPGTFMSSSSDASNLLWEFSSQNNLWVKLESNLFEDLTMSQNRIFIIFHCYCLCFKHGWQEQSFILSRKRNPWSNVPWVAPWLQWLHQTVVVVFDVNSKDLQR